MKIAIVLLVAFAALYCEGMVIQGGAYHQQGDRSSASGSGVDSNGGRFAAGGCSRDGSSCSSSISVGGGGGGRGQQGQHYGQQGQQQYYGQQQQQPGYGYGY